MKERGIGWWIVGRERKIEGMYGEEKVIAGDMGTDGVFYIHVFSLFLYLL